MTLDAFGYQFNYIWILGGVIFLISAIYTHTPVLLQVYLRPLSIILKLTYKLRIRKLVQHILDVFHGFREHSFNRYTRRELDLFRIIFDFNLVIQQDWNDLFVHRHLRVYLFQNISSFLGFDRIVAPPTRIYTLAQRHQDGLYGQADPHFALQLSHHKPHLLYFVRILVIYYKLRNPLYL